MITLAIFLVTLGILGWGFYRAQPFGKLGILAWLQSSALMAPWLIFFGLSSVGLYLGLAGILFLFVASTGLYIYLGRQLRAASENAVLPSQTAAPDGVEANPAASTPGTPKPPTSEAAGAPDIIPIPEEDLRKIQGIFGLDTFYVTETKPYQEGVILVGNLRGEPEPTIARLTTALQKQFEGQEPAPGQPKYRLFMLPQEEKPIVVVLPSTTDPKPTNRLQWGLAVLLLVATLGTCLETAGLILGFDFLTAPQRILETLPFGLGLIALLAVHEGGHRWQAHRHQVRLSPPFFIPTWQIGSFGGLFRFESVLPSRKVLFDVAIAGPLAGIATALGFLLAGLALSHGTSPDGLAALSSEVVSQPDAGLFQIPSQFFQGSALVGTLAKAILGDALKAETVAIHPFVLLGWVGMVMNALNLMPAGQLDGGRIVQAIYGRKTAGRTTVATLIFLGLASFINPLALYWAIVILILQRDLERPSLNEVTEPDDARAALALVALFIMVATLIPLSPGLAGRLGIGG